MSKFLEMAPKWLQNSCPQKIKTFKYEHTVHTFLRNLGRASVLKVS